MAIIPEQCDEFSEEERDFSGCKDTLLHPLDFSEDGEHALRIAPGEGNHPISLFLDKDCEEKSFPTIFCGERRPSNSERYSQVTYLSTFENFPGVESARQLVSDILPIARGRYK